MIEWKNTSNRKERKFKLYWSQAKDDITHHDIFRMYMGTSEDRAVIAKYCIKDCKLVNLLINKSTHESLTNGGKKGPRMDELTNIKYS